MSGGGTAYAYFQAGRLDEAVSTAKKALIQNPRFTVALRNLAASLARQGRNDDAAEAMRELLAIEPNLTLTRLRGRMMNVDDTHWNEYSAALRLAGLPE
jgi:tetratricopeptide (TPR) repeat protein